MSINNIAYFKILNKIFDSIITLKDNIVPLYVFQKQCI